MSDHDTVTLVDAEGLGAAYGATRVLRDVTFSLRAGERIGVLGPNGGGKTTLFRLLLGELEPAEGRFELAGRCGFVPQTERSRLDYPVSALDVALMGTLSRIPWWRLVPRAERRFARRALAQVGLEELAGQRFGELSGGQRQRVLVARALVQNSPVLLLDEPFIGVDLPSSEILWRLIGELAEAGRGILVSTHDVEQARALDRVLCLNRRQIAFGEPGRVLTRAVLEQTYGAEIVTVPDEDGTAVGVLPPHHH